MSPCTHAESTPRPFVIPLSSNFFCSSPRRFILNVSYMWREHVMAISKQLSNSRKGTRLRYIKDLQWSYLATKWERQKVPVRWEQQHVRSQISITSHLDVQAIIIKSLHSQTTFAMKLVCNLHENIVCQNLWVKFTKPETNILAQPGLNLEKVEKVRFWSQYVPFML